MQGCIKFIGGTIAVLAALASIIGLYFAYQEYVASRDDRDANQPRVYACIQDFSYQGMPSGGDLQMRLSAEVRLVNTGNEGTTVTSISFNPIGTWRNGQQGGIGMYEDPRVDQPIDGNGVAVVTINNFRDSAVVNPDYWIDNADYINVHAITPDGAQPTVQCQNNGVGWSCGERDQNTGALSVESACR